MKLPPFVTIGGRTYLNVGFDLEPVDRPPLTELLKGLLRNPDEADLVLLRPLDRREVREMAERIREAQVEAWASIVVDEGDRIRPRRRTKRRAR